MLLKTQQLNTTHGAAPFPPCNAKSQKNYVMTLPVYVDSADAMVLKDSHEKDEKSSHGKVAGQTAWVQYQAVEKIIPS